MKDYAEIVMVLDKSGSMAPLTDDTIKSFNNFVKEQAEVGDNASLSLYTFDNNVNVVWESVKINKVEPLTRENYNPGGGTALNDGMGKAIDDLGDRLAKLKEEDRPNKVIIVTLTDGAENMSKKFTTEQIKEKVKHQQSKYNWQFLFLGANIDAFAVGGSYGIPTSGCMNFAATPMGMNVSANANTRAIKDYRTGKLNVCSYQP